MNFQKALSFKDVLLVPKYSEISSRSLVDVSVTLTNEYNYKFKFNSPVIVANMRDLIGEQMLLENVKYKNLCFMHRFVSFEEQLSVLQNVKSQYPDTYNYIGVSLGIKDEDKDNLHKFHNEGIKLFCIDIAHGHSKMCIEMIRYIKKCYNDVLLVAGNVATGVGAEDLWKNGADVVKSGVGSGSICSTRLTAATGVPQLHAIMEVASVKKQTEKILNRQLYFISDGGIREIADVVKALCFCDMVMAGNMFAGSTDTPGNLIKINDTLVKSYHGSSTHKNKHIEGFKGAVHLKPSFVEILDECMQGLKSGCSYQDVKNLFDLKTNPQFVEITNAGIIESGAHDIIVHQ